MSRGTVVHYLPRWLPPSEQFVDQVVRRSAYRPVVVARRGLVHPEAFPQRPLHRLDRLLRLAPSSQERRAVAAALRCLLAWHRARVLHVHFGFEVEGVVGAARRAGVPLVVSVHGNDVTAGWSKDRPALRYALEAADAVVVPSAFLADHAVVAGAGRERVHVLPSGVDRSVFTSAPPHDGPPTVVFVGRFVEKKGLDVLARAWPAVRSAVPEARLLLLGDGPLDAMGLIPDAERWVPEPYNRVAQVRRALERASVVVTPSRTAADGDSESLLLVNLEAQAVGRAVVTTRHGGIPDAVEEGRCAELVPEGDDAALAAALVAVLRDPDRAAAMGRAGLEVAARFDADLMSARVDSLYDRLLR
jgi:glycosyltransferase involved in cell wall biosynthesis